MAVIVQYIVEKNGTVKMTFDNKKEAEAYDKTLDIAANMWVYLEKSGIDVEEEKLEELCMFIATNKDETMAILKGSATKLKDSTSKDSTSKDSTSKDKSPAAEDKSNEKPDNKNIANNSTKATKNKKQAA